jgi:peptide/nickel transport system substrate-binding protein
MPESYWDSLRRRSLSRRRLIARGSAAAAGLTGLAIVGCGDDDDDDDDSEATATETTSGTSEPTSEATTGEGTPEGTATAAPTSAEGTPQQGGTLRVTHIGPSALPYDPHQSPAESQGIIWETVGGSLVRANRSLELRNYLAEGWEAPDETTYTFTLHDNIKFEDREPVNGRVFTAEDVVFNVNRAVQEDPKYLIAKPKFKFMESVEAVDDKTVRFVMTKPYAPFPVLLGVAFWFVAPEALDANGEAITPDSVRGPGPYKAVTIEEASFLRLEKNPNWFQPDAVYADAIEATYYAEPGSAAAAFASGQLDLIHNSTGQDRVQLDGANVEYKTQEAFSAGHFSFEVNPNVEPFGDARVRKALNLALDRQALVRLTEAASNPGEPLGVIANWIQPFALPTSELYERPGFREPKDDDLAEAIALLDAAGYNDSNPLSFPGIAWVAWSETFAVWVQDWLTAIGVDMQIEEVETYSGLIGRMGERDFAGAVSGYSIGPEPDDQIYDFYHSTGLRNYTSFGSPEIDAAIDAQQAELDVDARIELLHQLQRDIMDADPGLLWLHGNGIVATMIPPVNGWEMTPDSVHDYRFDQAWIAS